MAAAAAGTAAGRHVSPTAGVSALVSRSPSTFGVASHPYADGDYAEQSDTEHEVDSVADLGGVPTDDGSPRPGAEGSPKAGGGAGPVVWHAVVWRDGWNDPKHCTADGELKPRRPVPQLRSADLLRRVHGGDGGGRWAVAGELNGWPGLAGLELRSITCRVKAKRDVLGMKKIARFWQAGGAEPALQWTAKMPNSVRATLWAPAWTRVGWAEGSPGFAFWYEALRPEGPRLTHGTDMARTVEADGAPPRATRAHHFAHRYPHREYSIKDRLTWHTAVLVEWEHGRHTTVIEVGYLNGLGGYGGRSNWVPDKHSECPGIFAAMAPGMKVPWDVSRAEIRVTDVAARSVDEFRAYLDEHSEKSGLPVGKQRFIEPTVAESADVRLMHRSQADIMRYLVSYIRRRGQYTESGPGCSNCQTFSADLFGLLVAKEHPQPYSPVIRAGYKPRTYLFLYDP